MTACIDPACNIADVTSGRLSPQPVACRHPRHAGARGLALQLQVRLPAVPRDHHRGLPDRRHHARRTSTSSAPPSAPSGDRARCHLPAMVAHGHSCNPSGTVTVTGNWWVDCPGGLSIGNGTTVDFAGGNVVFDGGISMTGGALTFNDNNPNASLPIGCLPPTVTTPCIDNSSAKAAIVYVRNGDMEHHRRDLTIDHVTVYQNAGVREGRRRCAPHLARRRPKGRSLNSALVGTRRATSSRSTAAQACNSPACSSPPRPDPSRSRGGGDWGQLNAQFISYRFSVSGGGTLTMAPNAQDFIQPPAKAGVLIR